MLFSLRKEKKKKIVKIRTYVKMLKRWKILFNSIKFIVDLEDWTLLCTHHFIEL